MGNASHKTIMPSSASKLEKALDINNAVRFGHDLQLAIFGQQKPACLNSCHSWLGL